MDHDFDYGTQSGVSVELHIPGQDKLSMAQRWIKAAHEHPATIRRAALENVTQILLAKVCPMYWYNTQTSEIERKV